MSQLIHRVCTGKHVCAQTPNAMMLPADLAGQEPPPVGDDDLVPLVLEALPNVWTGTWRLEYNVGLVEVYESDRITIFPSAYLFSLPMTPNPGNYWIEGLGLTQSAALTLKVDFDGDGTVDTTDSVLVSVIRADLDGDGDHDGVINDNGPDDDMEDTLPGVIVLANQDDDDSDDEVDHVDAEVNLGDAGDLAPLVIRQIPGIPSNWMVKLTLEGAANVASGIDADEVVRIFPDDAAGTAALLGPGTSTFTLVEDAASHDVDLAGLRSGDVLLYVEGLEFAGEVKLVLEVVDNTGTMRRKDRVQLKVAPLILLGHLDSPIETFVSQVNDTPDRATDSAAYCTQRFPDATTGVTDTIIPPVLNGGWDPWAQDEFQIGYQEAPYTAPMYVVLDSKRDGGLKPFPESLEGPGFGRIQVDSGADTNSLDFFGNLEVSPPIAPAHPFGRIYFGDGSIGGRHMDGDLQAFLLRQAVQHPVTLDSDWLLVGHVDEFMSVVSNPLATNGWSVLIADPVLALGILTGNDLIASGVDEKLHIPRYADYGVVQLGALLGLLTSDGSSTIEAFNSAGGPVDTMLAQVRSQLEDFGTFGFTSSADLVSIPVLFDSVLDPANPGVSKSVGITPDIVNSAVHGSILIAPNPFLHGSIEEDTNANWQLDPGEDLNGDGMLDTLRDPFQLWINQELPGGIAVTYIDDWFIYHINDGEVHCGSNEMRAIASHPLWWESVP